MTSFKSGLVSEHFWSFKMTETRLKTMNNGVRHQHCLGYFLRLATVSDVCGCVMEVELLQCE